MIGFIRKLVKDRRGNVLAIAAAALPLVVGAAGLATDTIQWTLWKRQLQRAADSAAIAGVYDRSSANGATTGTPNAVCYDLAKNVHTWMSLKGTSPCTGSVGSYSSIAYPANTGFVINQVSVTLQVQQALPFSSLFVSTPPIITASATAGSVSAGGTACMQALESSPTTPGITNNGNTTVTAQNCILYSNSPASNAASAGGNSSVTAKAIAAVGGISQSNNWHVSSYIPYSPPLPDPFANVNVDYADMHCTASALTKNTDLSAAALGNTNCFSAMSIQPSDTINLNGTALDGKTVYINGGGVDLKGTFTCTCTIVLTNSDPSSSATIGSYDSNAQAHNNITAPTTGNYAGIAIYQDRRASPSLSNTVNGGSGNVIRGAVYFPNSILKINGTGDVASDGSALKLCAMWVAKDINLIGTSSIAINAPDDSACVGSGMPAPSAVRQVRVLS